MAQELLTAIQTSFAGGELSPQLYARVDLAKYRVGAALLRNFFVDYRGGASTRPGTEFVGRAKDSSRPVRLIPFQFSTLQTYVLEFGELYMRVIMDGGYVLNADQNITTITQADPAVVTSAGHGYSNGDWIFISDVAGMTELNGQTFIISGVTANTFELNYLDGNPVDSATFTAYASGGIVASVYTETSPFAAEDLALVKFTQSADVLTLVHLDYTPQDLTRTAHNVWTFTPITFTASITPPVAGFAFSASGAGTTNYSYMVTSINADGEESVASAAIIGTGVDISSTAGYIQISWTAVVGATSYRVYKAQPLAGIAQAAGAPHGFAGETTGASFIDGNIIQDFTRTPPVHTNPLNGADNNPGTVTYFKQRRVFGGTNNFPQTLWMTQPGAFYNMDVRFPPTDADAIVATLVSQQVNAIKSMLPIVQGLVVLTSGSAWQVTGSPLSPSTAQADPQSYNGTSDVPPIVINYDILYIQAKGSSVRDLEYNFFANIYTGKDISVLANHLFFGRQVKEWCWAEEPFKLVWIIRDDGTAITLSYLKEQDVYGYSRHDTLGEFSSTCSIVEGDEDVVYFVVDRFIGGGFVKYIERLASRKFTSGVESAWCVDCGLQYPLTYPAAGATVTHVHADDTATIVADASVFSPSSVGDILRIDGGKIEITTYTSATEVSGDVINNFNHIENIPIQADEGEWSLTTPVTRVTGLQHLIGETVQILADGSVQPTQVVAEDGSITLEQSASLITVGLGFQAQLQTLDLDVGGEDAGSSIQGKRKRIPAITIRIADSRGLKVGNDFDNLEEFPERSDQPYGQPIPLLTTDERFPVPAEWETSGRMCVQQDYPLPATVLGIIPEVMVGDD